MAKRKTIGLVGGMSPFSTAAYYLDIVRLHERAFGDASYPRIVIASVSFQEVIDLQHEGDWNALAAYLQPEFDTLVAAGAEIIGLTTNTMHRLLPGIHCDAEIVSVHDAIAEEAQARNAKKLGLTGTRFTMNDPNYREALESRGLEVVTPNPKQQDTIHRIIYEELVKGSVEPESSKAFQAICEDLLAQTADLVLLGCTELRLLQPTGNQLLDSTAAHSALLWSKAVQG